MWWKIIIFLAMSAIIVLSYLTPAPQKNIGESSRIFYYHVPQAWICVLAFTMSMVYSIKYLRSRDLNQDDKAVVAASLGFIFCVLATLSGAVFAKVTWGTFWNWDPRQTSIFILLLIYAAYFALRGSIEVEEKRATLSGVYSIFAFITVPFLIFVIPRIMPSLHPESSIVDENMKLQMTSVVATIFFSSLTIFTLIYLWMFNLARRERRLTRIREEALL